MSKPREVELKVGRRSTDGIVRVSLYPPTLVQLSVSYRGERAASVVLTREQVRDLREALAQLENEIPPSEEIAGTWDKRERRLEEPILVSEGH